MGTTIAIATYNRADELRLTLAGLMHLQTDGAGDYEILVVGNGCTDATEDVATEFANTSGGLVRYVREPKQGLSHARNRAIAESRYDVVAFLDDDVDVDPMWLVSIVAAFKAGDYAVVGGRAHLVYPVARPVWLDEASEGWLTKVDYGPHRREAGHDELYGLNFSVRKALFDRVGGFRTDLGRVGRCLMGSEETELLERISRAGGKLLYEPAAAVGHRVSRERLRRRWFWSRCYWGARAAVRAMPDHDVSTYQTVRGAWHVHRALWKSAVALGRSGPRSEHFFRSACDVSARFGKWVGLAEGLLRRSARGRAGAGAHRPVAQVEAT